MQNFHVALLLVFSLGPLAAQTYQFKSLSALTPVNVKAELANYRGRPAVRLLEDSALSANQTPVQAGASNAMAVLSNSDFEDGTIEAELAAAPRAGAGEGARGFAGIAFRIQPDGSHFECFYLRPTNGRAADPVICSPR